MVKAAAPRAHIGKISHTEFASKDPQATMKFLEAVFGWKFQANPHSPGYHTFRAAGGTGGGVRGVEAQELPGSTVYVEVESLGASRRRIERAGGKIVLPETDVGGQGAILWCQVPGGPVVALWETYPETIAARDRQRRKPAKRA